MATLHELKTWPEFFAAVASGEKTFELRSDDRQFRSGDTLLLREFYPSTETYSGAELRCAVTYVLRGPAWGLEKGYAILALDRRAVLERAAEAAPTERNAEYVATLRQSTSTLAERTVAAEQIAGSGYVAAPGGRSGATCATCVHAKLSRDITDEYRSWCEVARTDISEVPEDFGCWKHTPTPPRTEAKE